MSDTEITGKPLVFAFGDPEPILSNNMTDYLGIFLDTYGDYYRPPVDLTGLANLMNANSYHGPILHFKKNMIAKWFTPSPVLSLPTLRDAALDYAVTANCYFQQFTNRLGQVVRLARLPAVNMRKSTKKDVYVQLHDGLNALDKRYTEFKPGEVIHLKETDLKQSVYGVPQYFGGIQSVLLSEESTLFRRKYFSNGAHMGYILVTSDANIDDKTAKAIEKQVSDSKGPGNFRSLYINIANSRGAKEPVKIIPVGNIGSKDEYAAIKEVTEMEMLAMHRVPPVLVNIIPTNTGGFESSKDANDTYYENEVIPLQQVFLALNEHLSRQVVAFRQPDWKQTGN